MWVALVGVRHVVVEPQSVVQPESACHDGFFVRSVSQRLGILGNARSRPQVFSDGVVDFFATDGEINDGHFDLRGVLLHVELLSTAPRSIGVVRVANVLFNVHV